LYITATKNGFFVNGGYKADEKGDETLVYEAQGSTYPTITTLLREQSPHFASTVDKQDFAFKPANKPQIEVPMAKSDANAQNTVSAQATHEDDVRHGSSAEGAEERNQTLSRKPVDHATPKQQLVKSGSKKKKTTSKKLTSNMGPSAKWRHINVQHHDEERRKHVSPNRTHELSDRVSDILARRQAARETMYHEDSETSDSEAALSSDEDFGKRQESNELPAEFWQIQKLVKYLRVGNQTATIIAICALRDFDLRAEANQLAIRDVGGLEILVNLLDTEDPRCIRGALHVLKDISNNGKIFVLF
jgi:hypothetical protein